MRYISEISLFGAAFMTSFVYGEAMLSRMTRNRRAARVVRAVVDRFRRS